LTDGSITTTITANTQPSATNRPSLASTSGTNLDGTYTYAIGRFRWPRCAPRFRRRPGNSEIWRCDPRRGTRASTALSGRVSMLRLSCLRSGRPPVVQVRAACTSGLASAFGASFCHGVAGRERRSTPHASSLSHQPRGVSLRRSGRMCGAMLSAWRALRAMERASTTSWPGPVTPWC